MSDLSARRTGRTAAAVLNLSAVLLAATAALCCVAGCDDGDEEEEGPASSPAAVTSVSAPESADATGSAGEPATTDGELVPMTDPVENAFSVRMPKGWKNQAYSVRTYDIHRAVGTSLSPDGDTLIFFGDPKMPGFSEPNELLQENSPFANLNPLFKVRRFVPAEQFFTEYVRKRYGSLPGFRITATEPDNPGLERLAREAAQRGGFDPKVTTTLIRFEYAEDGKPMRALVNGATLSIGTVWVADVSGISTSGDRDPAAYNDLLFRVGGSFRTDPEWKARQQALHEERMAQLRRNHDSNMAWIRASSERHQARMKALHAQADAGMQRWYQQQASSDASHRRFLNYITDEETVVGSGGRTFQVPTGHDRYYLNKQDNTYVGADSTTDRDDLRKRGLNPDDYEEFRVRR